VVERETQLAFLGRIAVAAEAGEGQLAVVTGEAGAGKTRLTRELVAALGDDWQRLFVHVQAGATNPFGDLVGEVAAGDAPASAIGSALGRALALRAGARPLVVVVEDLERADPVLIAALTSMLDALAEARVLVAAAFRLDGRTLAAEQTAALADVLRAPCAHEVRLESLSRAGVVRMAEAMGRHLGEAELDGLHSRADGNPFFVEELLNDPSQKLPWTISEAIIRRLDALPAPARGAAQALACAFDPVPRGVIEAVVPDGGVGAIALLDVGIAVESAPDLISLRHALFSEVAAAQLTASDRREWHRRLAENLEQVPDPSAARLTRHWREAGDTGHAARWAVTAADEAAGGRAYRTATELYRVALSMPGGEELEQAELFERAAVAAGAAGFADAALEWASNADVRYRRAGEQWRAVAMWLNPALREVPKPALDHRALAADATPRLLIESHDATRRGAYDQATELARRALALSDERTDLGVLSAASAARRLYSTGRLGEGEEILLRLRALATASANRSLLASLSGGEAMFAAVRGEFIECLMLNRQALALAQDGEQGTWSEAVAVALTLVYVGELDEAGEIVSGLLDSDDPFAVEFAQLPACVIDLERADLERARQRLDRIRAVTSLGVADWTVGVLLARARWQYLSGEYEDVLATVAEVSSVTGDLFGPSRLHLLILAIRSASELDDDARADAARAALDQIVELGGGRGCRAAASWAHGFSAARRGSFDDASTLLTSAAETFEASGLFVHAAEAWVDLAVLASTAGDPAVRERATARAREIGEPRRFASVLGRLERQPADPRRDAAGRLGALSEREQEIALLVVAGKTNREIAAALFVSEHTIRNQLVNVFAKLGISRRTELARVALGGAPPDVEQSGHRDSS
jgi:DNA-binding CsgD family transcriptional regulator